MNILFIAPKRQAFLPVLKTLRRGRNQVRWYSGVFQDLYKHLGENAAYLLEVDPRNFDSREIRKVNLADFDVAVVDLSADREHPTMLDFDGASRPTDIVSVLTMAGIVVIGISRDGRYLPQLEEAGAVMVAAHDRLDDRYLTMMKEARRLLADNSPGDGFALRALTLRQPWAASVFLAGKDMENRLWPARVRGTIAIHVSKEQPAGSFAAGARFIHSVLRAQGKTRIRFNDEKSLPKGSIIGVVDIVDCVTDSESPWFEGPLGFKLANPRILSRPIPASGRRRFWKVSKAVELRIRRDLGKQGFSF